ncbi:MAG: hypothetical protein DRR19_11850 [Candidatus Parabeggiatoa sp. nov. 1]|nr:MAG: hypothetical protein DRR19_11850 [Gammaproteobacteria bacterium]
MDYRSQQRRKTIVSQQQEQQQWRKQRLTTREQRSQLPVVTTWIAVLVMVDNWNQKCFCLPLFTVGSKVTAEMVVEALQELLPPKLQFLISDRGIHLTAKVFQQLSHKNILSMF